MQAGSDLVKSFLVSQAEGAAARRGAQSQPRRRKYQKGRIADRIIRPMAKG